MEIFRQLTSKRAALQSTKHDKIFYSVIEENVILPEARLHVRIYMDEAGLFVPPNPPRSSFSLVLALIIPTAIEKDLFYEFLRLRDTSPNQNVEIKGSSLDESQAAQVINLVLRYDALG